MLRHVPQRLQHSPRSGTKPTAIDSHFSLAKSDPHSNRFDLRYESSSTLSRIPPAEHQPRSIRFDEFEITPSRRDAEIEDKATLRRRRCFRSTPRWNPGATLYRKSTLSPKHLFRSSFRFDDAIETGSDSMRVCYNPQSTRCRSGESILPPVAYSSESNFTLPRLIWMTLRSPCEKEWSPTSSNYKPA